MNSTPVRSGNAIIDSPFDVCVQILLWLADLFGVSYNTVNIWIFCVVWPILTAGLVAVVVWQWRGIRRLRRVLEQRGAESAADKNGK